MNNSTSNKLALAALVTLATVTTARAEQDSRKDANSVGTGETIRDAGTYSPGKTTPRYKPTVGTKLVRWPGPIRSPVVSALTVLSCAGLHH